MMRRPTPIDEQLQWWRLSVYGEGTPPITDEPQCGWYKCRLVRGGVWVPAQIWLDQSVDERGELEGDEILRCRVANLMKDPYKEWLWLAPNPITQEAHDYLEHVLGFAREHDRRSPEANPHRPVDWLRTTAPSFKRN